MTKVRYTYRLRPGKKAQAYLSQEWGCARFVWNEMVAEAKARHEAAYSIAAAGSEPLTFGPADADKFLTRLRATVKNTEGEYWLAEGSSVAQQQVVRDFSRARSAALADIAARKPMHQRRGLPRFKSKFTSRPSLNYTKRGFTLVTVGEKLRLRLPGGVLIPVVFSRKLPSNPSSVRLYQESDGHWYASFVVEAPDERLPTKEFAGIGIDWGVREVATTVTVTKDGTIDDGSEYDLPSVGHHTLLQREIATQQRAMARRRPTKGQAPSKGYKRSKKRHAQLQVKAKNRRKDAAHKWSRKIVREHTHIAVEDFKPKFLSSSTMARKAADNAAGYVKQTLIYQASKTGRVLVLVDPRHTTMDCAKCDARATHRLPLSERTYTCQACGFTRPRDKNSAEIVFKRAGFNPHSAEQVRPTCS